MPDRDFLQIFTKSRKDRILGGICGGLGERTPLPSWAWRFLFVLMVTIYGVGLFIYLVIWIFAPTEAKTDH